MNVPVMEKQVCQKSPPVSDFHQLQNYHADWIEDCLHKATVSTTSEFTPYFKRFTTFYDNVTVYSRCADNDTISEKYSGYEDFTSVSREGWGSFHQCQWSGSTSPVANGEW